MVIRQCFTILLFLSVTSSWQPPLGAEDSYPLILDGQQVSTPPFASGEKLRFEVNWKPLFLIPAFKAGELTLTVEESQLNGKLTYKISARAVSDGMLSRVAGLQVRDYFESNVDRADFRSYRFLQEVRQGEKEKDIELIFNYRQNEATYQETDVTTDPPRETRKEVIAGMEAPVVDVLSVFYVTRLRKLEPEDRFLVYLNDRDQFKKVRVAAKKRERVKTPLGRYSTVLLSSEGGLFSGGGEFRIWYSQDELRVPVKFEADVKFGKVYGSLIELQTRQMIRQLISVD